MKPRANSTVPSRAKQLLVRCAIYTRKSTEEGLEQEFNTLDAQREAGESYIASQQHEGWFCLSEKYDDGGYTGANMERPALKRLFAEIERGRVDCVVVYKVDRLSRSFIDFARILETFDKHQVSFVSVTQPFNTSTSMGRFILNMLCNFAQFERETISERTRDKIAAARRKGKWSGGMPVLGYDVDAHAKLAVNEDEAKRVRAIFDLYIEKQSLIQTARELNCRGWTTKRWSTRKGPERGGQPFDKARLLRLLTNVVYLGKIRYKDEVHTGEHQAIIEPTIFESVQSLLRSNGRTGGTHIRNKHGALLKGLLYCKVCARPMMHTFSSKSNRAYRYYVCYTAQSRGWDACTSKSIPAEEIERFVVDQIRAIGGDPEIKSMVLDQARTQAAEEIATIERDSKIVERELSRTHAEMTKVAIEAAANAHAAARLADLHEKLEKTELRYAELRELAEKAQLGLVTKAEVDKALEEFTRLWDMLVPREQARVLQLLIQRVEYDGAKGKIAITFHANGFRTLGQDGESEVSACSAA